MGQDADQAAGGRLAAEHLVSLGVRSCVAVAGPEDLAAARTVDVTVVNPEPNAGASNRYPFTIEVNAEWIYLPLL